jgi:transposase
VLPILLNIKPSEVNDKLFLRTFPYLQEKTTIPIQKEIHDKITQVYEIKTEKIYYDITSSYFEGKSCPLSKYGYKVEEKLQKTKSDIESGKHNLTDRRKKNISCMLKSQKVGKFIKLEFTDNGFTFERINETIEKSRKYEGVFLLSTTEIDLKGEEILKIYREKDIIEKAFRTIKSEIEMRPFFLSTEKSVIGYVFICALAYQIRSVLKVHMKKSNSEMSIEDAFEILNRYKVVKIAVEEKGVQVYRKVAIEGQKAIDVIHCFDLESEFEKVSCLNSVKDR